MMKFIVLTIISGIALVFGFFAGEAHGIDKSKEKDKQ